MTDFRARGTIMGLTGLTAVFGMGTGGTPSVWSPESGRGAVRPPRSRRIRVDRDTGRWVVWGRCWQASGVEGGIVSGFIHQLDQFADAIDRVRDADG